MREHRKDEKERREEGGGKREQVIKEPSTAKVQLDYRAVASRQRPVTLLPEQCVLVSLLTQGQIRANNKTL